MAVVEKEKEKEDYARLVFPCTASRSKVLDRTGNKVYGFQKDDGFTDHILKTLRRITATYTGRSLSKPVRAHSRPNLHSEPLLLSSYDKANLVFEHGPEKARLIIERDQERRHKLQAEALRLEEHVASAARRDKRFVVYKTAITSIFRFIEDYQPQGNGLRFKLDPFQMEIIRGVVVTCAEKQLGVDLYRYKHEILLLLKLGSYSVAKFDPEIHNPRVKDEIDRLFDEYDKPYELAVVPRQCGKTTIISITLAAMLSFLSLVIMVQAQSLQMAGAIKKHIERFMGLLNKRPWFPDDYKLLRIDGQPKDTVYVFKKGVKDCITQAHYIASGKDVSITQ